jgi:adenylate cyclase
LRADHYDGNLAELFQLQDRIAEQTLKLIAPHVHERELKRALKKHPQNMTAYDLVLQALEALYRLDYASFSRARGLLQRAMVLDPSYAPAFSYAAWWHSGRISQAWTNNSAMDAAEAMRLAQAALDRDPNDALALAVYGHEQSYLRKEYDLAIDSFDRALTACPNLALAWTLKALTLCFIGDGPSALRCAQQGLRLSPRHQNVGYAEHIVAQAHYVNGDFGEAISWSRRSIAHSDRDTSSLRTLISSLVAVGALEEARSVASQHREIAPQFSIREWAARSSMSESFKKSRSERLRTAGLAL